MKWRADLAVLSAATLLAGCATTRPVVDGAVKIGQPYKIAGRTYVPRDDRSYDKTGLASWYGPGHHGLKTANGERFDMDALTAAHPTLPLPSYVEVTAQSTGRRLLVRINDRGPFVDNRIIDLSRGTARALGVEKEGVTRVRVRRVYPSEAERQALLRGRTVQTAATSRASAVPPAAAAVAVTPSAQMAPPSTVEPLSAPVQPVAVVTTPLPPAHDMPLPAASTATMSPAAVRYIQVAALGDGDRADALAVRLSVVANSSVDAGGDFYRVRLGPFADEDAARSALAEVRRRGYQDAHIVTALP